MRGSLMMGWNIDPFNYRSVSGLNKMFLQEPFIAHQFEKKEFETVLVDGKLCDRMDFVIAFARPVASRVIDDATFGDENVRVIALRDGAGEWVEYFESEEELLKDPYENYWAVNNRVFELVKEMFVGKLENLVFNRVGEIEHIPFKTKPILFPIDGYETIVGKIALRAYGHAIFKRD